MSPEARTRDEQHRDDDSDIARHRHTWHRGYGQATSVAGGGHKHCRDARPRHPSLPRNHSCFGLPRQQPPPTICPVRRWPPLSRARRLLLREADGYIEQTFDSRRRYRATLRLAALGCQVIAHAQLPRTAAPYVALLHRTTHATAHLFIPSYTGVACVVHCDDRCSDAPPARALRELLPAHATAPGKLLHAFRQAWRNNVLARGLRRYTDATLTAPADIERAATEIRARGYAIEKDEYRRGWLTIAAPVFVRGDVADGLAHSTPQRGAGKHLVDWLIDSVATTAATLRHAFDEAEGVNDVPAPIRAALLRKALADAAQRVALARRLGVTESHVLAIQHLACAGELTPGQLSARLQLSSGGATGLIDRMQRASHVDRMSHPRRRAHCGALPDARDPGRHRQLVGPAHRRR
jgi:DNA-binding IclR family transcriptional regulator